MKIQGRRVLLTGATGGIGGAIARELAQRGAELVLTGRKPQALAGLAQELGARVIAADLARPEEIERLLGEAGEIDILVANAGLPAMAPLTKFSTRRVGELLDVNLRAPILLARGLMDGMRARGGGHLLFISSLAGLVASPLSGLYSASKYGLRGFAQCMRLDLHDAGVGVSCVFPGIIRDAGMFVDSGGKAPRGIGTNTTEDVARAVVRAIERNLAELMVAPAGLKLWSRFAAIAPTLAGSVQLKAGAARVVERAVGDQAE